MKRLYILTLIAALCAATISNAQIQKGSIFLGGGISGATIWTETSTRQNIISVQPAVGKAIRDNLIIGGELGLFLWHV